MQEQSIVSPLPSSKHILDGMGQSAVAEYGAACVVNLVIYRYYAVVYAEGRLDRGSVLNNVSLSSASLLSIPMKFP